MSHTLGNLTIDRSQAGVWVAGEPVTLTYVEFELLYQLARSAGRIVSRRRLMRAIWQDGSSPGDRKLTVHVCRLRGKLTRSHPWRINTYSRRGYALMDTAASIPSNTLDGEGVPK
jgi:two-component system response regulator RstA